jgi:ABC-2 type transport system ATP-binding protein
MLVFNEITKIFNSDLFGKTFSALKNVSFRVDAGKIVGFLGANGAGKTTSIKIAMDFIRPTSGNVHFETILGSNKNEIFRNIGFLPERPYFYPHLTGRDFCYYMGSLCGLKRATINDEMAKWAPRFRIDHALDREMKNYSKGMLQRIGFVATVLHNPRLLILDEPLSGLDPIGRKEIKDMIVEVNNEGKTVFFSSHIVSDVEEICDNVIFLKSGELFYEGSVDKIIQDNIKPEYNIRYRQQNEFKNITVSAIERNLKLKELLSNDCDIISVQPQRLTLEEIIYNVK